MRLEIKDTTLSHYSGDVSFHTGCGLMFLMCVLGWTSKQNVDYKAKKSQIRNREGERAHHW